MLNDLTPAEALDLGARLLACGVRLDFSIGRHVPPDGATWYVGGRPGVDGVLDLRDAGTFGHVWEEFERRTAGALARFVPGAPGLDGGRLRPTWYLYASRPALHCATSHMTALGPCLTRAHALVAAFEALTCG